MVKKYFWRKLGQLNNPLRRILERQLILQAQQIKATRAGGACSQIDDLSCVEYSVFSQWGEDGIINWLIDRVPDIPQTFVEFGVEDYREANTRLLLHLRNWRGLVIDGSAENVDDICRQDIYWRYELHAKCSFIDAENINKLILDAGFSGDIGILSIDIDGNDFWVWKAIDVVKPALVVCEYNAVLGDKFQLTVPYRPDFCRNKAHYSNLYFGASLQALIKLGVQKGYRFVGTASSGCNAFFVRDDLAHNVFDALGAVRGFPSLFREARGQGGELLFVSGPDRAEIIKDLPLLNLADGLTTSLAELAVPCSREWSEGRKACFK